MHYIDRSALPNDKAPLNGLSSLAFNPAYILHAVLSLEFTENAGAKTLTFKKDLKAYEPRYADIDGFIAEVMDGRIKVPEIKPPPPKQPVGPPFDIGVDKNCFIVLQLDKNTNWMFSQTKVAVTRKDKSTSSEDGAVHHVRRDGTVTTQPIPDEECRIVYFEVLARGDCSPRLYDFNVRFLVGGYAIEVIIDPDIPNTGSKPFP